jgi:hypothetical protein
MANRQTYVIGALGVLVGMVVGASSAQRADLMSYAGHNPNSDIVRNMQNLHRAGGIFRSRSERETLDIRNGVSYHLTPGRKLTPDKNAAHRRTIRLSQLNLGSSRLHYAPTSWRTVRGAPALRRQRVGNCDMYTRTRYTSCLESYIRGEAYIPNYYSNY